MSGHTPGPWRWFKRKPDSDEEQMKYLVGSDEQGFAHTVGLQEPRDTANARLIAAAPDLLDGLTALADAADAYMRYHAEKFYAGSEVLPTGLWTHIQAARDIVKKATDA